MPMSFLRKTQTAWAKVRAHARAWRCRDKILVLESDDWGSIRTSNAKAYRLLETHGYEMRQSCYTRDALESQEDLARLVDILGTFQDQRGRPACLTTNMVMANPDFRAIQESGFLQYACEPVWVTWKRYHAGDVATLWDTGVAKGVFLPQFHAREHVCWWKWLEALRSGNEEAVKTFDLGMCGVPRAVSRTGLSFYCPPYTSRQELVRFGVDLEDMIVKGLDLFSAHFGFRSLSTVAPNVTWTDHVESIWAHNGVKYIQGGTCQHMPVGRRVHLRGHYLGEPSTYNGYYLVRNCTLEPSSASGGNTVARCLRQITRAFRARIPAIVGTHRVNYIGSIDARNRERGLTQLRSLLKAILKQWPDVYFLCSPELGYMIETGTQCVRELPNELAPGRKPGVKRRLAVDPAARVAGG